MRAALYIRVSTDEQTEFSPQAQKTALLDYAAKNEMSISPNHIFVDEGVSGRSAEKRPAFMEMIKQARTKPTCFDIILVHKFDRFSRSREDSVVYKSLLKKECGMKVISITEQLEDDKFSVILEGMLESMAEYYSLNLADEVKKGMTEKAKRGGFQTAPPLGYEMIEKKLIVKPEEALAIKYIFDSYVHKNHSLYTISQNLHALGFRTKRANKIDTRGITYILLNPIYIGVVRWTPTGKANRNTSPQHTILANGAHELIITEELFYLAQNKYKLQKKSHKRKQRPLEECSHWLSGILKCSNCSSTLVLTKSGTYNAFQCAGYIKGTCKVSHSISLKKVETAVLNELDHIIKLAATSQFTLANLEKTAEINLLQKQIKKSNEMLARAEEAYLCNVSTLLEYKKIKDTLQNKKQGYLWKFERLHNHNELHHNNFKTVTELLRSDCELILKQKAVRSIIETIVYNKENFQLEIYYPHPLWHNISSKQEDTPPI